MARPAHSYRGAKRNAARAEGKRYGTPRSDEPSLQRVINNLAREHALRKFHRILGAPPHRIGPGKPNLETTHRRIAKNMMRQTKQRRSVFQQAVGKFHEAIVKSKQLAERSK